MTVSSMTGFAHKQIQTVLGVLSIDLKSVNSRYQEIVIRLPEELRFLEGEIRSVISQFVARGKIECRMQWVGEPVHEQTLNQDAIKNLLALQQEIVQQYPEVEPLTVSQILNFPCILEPKSVDIDVLKHEVMNGLQQTIQMFLMARCREGDSLSKVVLSYCDRIEEIVNQLVPKLPNIIENIQKKLEMRLSEALLKTLTEHASLTKEEINDRIRQEVILYAIKLDVDEEINRLLAHIKEIRHLLNGGKVVGKELDFLVQELNREANTLGSKSVATEMTNTALALKTNIEKIREQIQNLE